MKMLPWYVARASGIVAWAMLAVSVVWGLLLSTRLFANKPKPAWTLSLHRFLGGLSLIFVGVHLAGLLTDTYVHFGVTELLVPFASRWHPVAVAWGVVALYLLIAIEGTSLLMKRLPHRIWLAVHRTGLGLFILTTFHFISAGTDARGHPATQITAFSITGLAVFLVLIRILSPRAAAMRARRAAAPAHQGDVKNHPDKRATALQENGQP